MKQLLKAVSYLLHGCLDSAGNQTAWFKVDLLGSQCSLACCKTNLLKTRKPRNCKCNNVCQTIMLFGQRRRTHWPVFLSTAPRLGHFWELSYDIYDRVSKLT